jgi:outer membrane protein assembly complex protein YaeT
LHLRISILAVVVVLASGLSARPESLETLRGHRVARVKIEGQGLSPTEVMKYVDIRPGSRFSPRAVRRSVKLLYHLGLFGQVRVVAEPIGERRDQSLILTFHLVPKRRVLSVEVLGNEILPASELRRLIPLVRGGEFDRWKMESAAAEVLALYSRRGYRRTRVIPEAEGPAEGDVRVRYYIQEGPPTRISRIWFFGDTRFKPKKLMEVMGLRPGDVADEKHQKAGLEKLLVFYREQDYLEVRITAPKRDYELRARWEVFPVEIQAGPRVVFRITGNDVIKKRELLPLLEVDQKELVLSSYVLRDLADRLEGRYRKQGFSKVRVSPEVSDDPVQNRKQITFWIEEGPRVSVREIRFEGNIEFSDELLRGYIENAMGEAIPQSLIGQPVDRGDMDPLGGGHPLSHKKRRVNRPQGFLFELVPETIYLREPYEKALSQIADLYRREGYLAVQVDMPLLSYDSSGSRLYITVLIVEGRQTRVESISFEGNQVVAATHLLEVAERHTGNVRPGGPLNRFGAEELRKELARTYARRGYVYCRVESQVLFSKDRSLAEVRYVFDEGPRVRVRRILVRGNVVTDPAVFDHILTLQRGEIFSPEKVTSSQEGLFALGVFSGVDIKMLDADVPESEKDVVVMVRERLPHATIFSLGISSAEGVRLELNYTQRNLFGYALEFVGKAKANYQVFYPLLPPDLEDRYEKMTFLEGMEGWVVTGLHWPRVWWLEKDVAARVDLIGLQDHAISFDLAKVSLNPGVDFKLTENLVFTVDYELEYDDLSCATGQECGGAAADRWRRYDEGRLLLGALRPEISWDRRDNLFRPHRGTFLSLRTELVNDLRVGPEVFYLKLDGLATGYLPLGRETTLALSIRGGLIFHLNDDSTTPSHKLFWLGGRNTVRGFPEEGLIPVDQLNPQDSASPCVPKKVGAGEQAEEVCISLGGNAFLLLKGELRFPLIPEILEGAFFVDLGNLWADPANVIDRFYLRSSAGFGMRFVTPIGLVAFDLAFNLDPDQDRKEEIWNLHFNIGVF